MTKIEKKIKSQNKAGHTRKAYQGIRKMLFHNEIGPGQKIAYRDLAERLGMSQTPVIQALKWLEFQNLVRHERNRGYYTAPVSLKEVEEVYDLRELIEVSLLARAMRRLDEKSLRELREAMEAHKRSAEQVYLYDRLIRDMEFHLILAALSECQVQLRTLKNLFDLLYLKYGGNILFTTSMNTAYADHLALYDLLVARDVKGAKRALSRHIRRVKKHVLAGLSRVIREKSLSDF